MSIEAHQNDDTFSRKEWKRIAGWLLLVISVPMILWVTLAGIIAVPYPSYLALLGGPSVACFLIGLGLLSNSRGSIFAALAALLLGLLGWLVLP